MFLSSYVESNSVVELGDRVVEGALHASITFVELLKFGQVFDTFTVGFKHGVGGE